jgi:hypothetical protein
MSGTVVSGYGGAGHSFYVTPTDCYIKTSNSPGGAAISYTHTFSNAWVHFALVRSGNVFTLYLDGGSKGTTTMSGTLANNALRFGRNGTDTGDGSGFVDEIRISNTARYTSGFTPSTTAFTEDSNTLLLIHSDTTNGSTTFTDDSGLAGGIANDASSNSNNWTTNNLAASDQMVDTPTNNFCTANPLSSFTGYATATLSEGNLRASLPDNAEAKGTMSVSSGKWYYEAYMVSTPNNKCAVGIHKTDAITYTGGSSIPNSTSGIIWFGHSGIAGGISDGTYGTYGAGTIIGVKLDMDSYTIEFTQNGTAKGSKSFSSLNWTSVTTALGSGTSNQDIVANFGQDSSFAGNKTAQGNQDSGGVGDFYYTPPSGFLALCSANLPSATVIPSEHFNTVTYSGTTDDSNKVVTGVGFQPDLLWIKGRSGTYSGRSHQLTDAIRGAGNYMESDTTDAEAARGGTNSFDSDGFTITGDYGVNGPGEYVSWLWKAGGTPVSNTSGTITSSVSANVDAGFSIVSYTGNGSSGTRVGHGLSKAPELMIIKSRTASGGDMNWHVYYSGWGASDNSLRLNLTNSVYGGAGYFWDNTDPTTSVFPIASQSNWNNITGADYIAYCFHSVDGHSKVGSYTGNGSADGTFVHTGFRPAYVLTKQTSGTNHWHIHDDKRNTFNVVGKNLKADAVNTEEDPSGGENSRDFLSNGFKFRHADHNNQNGHTYIFLAFAESPFKHSNAR